MAEQKDWERQLPSEMKKIYQVDCRSRRVAEEGSLGWHVATPDLTYQSDHPG
jgi:hypothetical protein